MKAKDLPTMTAGAWALASFKDTLVSTLAADKRGTKLLLYFYAVTESGWREVCESICQWRANTKGEVVAYVGTDHGLTDPDAIRLMLKHHISVRVMVRYFGVFHPKVVWLQGDGQHLVWIGSNNLTRDGLLNNIEFAALLQSKKAPLLLGQWADEVHDASDLIDTTALNRYDKERRTFAGKRVAIGTFTWSEREKIAPKVRNEQAKGKRIVASAPKKVPTAKGDLIIEVMPRETGPEGKQVQLPAEAATSFFKIPNAVGASKRITLTPNWIHDPRKLTLTRFSNHTVRLAIRELDYRDRPCVLVFKKRTASQFEFSIVSKSNFPVIYRQLLDSCKKATRAGSRKWTVI